MLELRLLGPLDVTAGDGRRDVERLRRRPKRAALLAYLAAAVPRGFHRRDTLLAMFWPELDAAHARAALSQSLYVLRSALGETALVTSGVDAIALADDVVWCDVRALEDALAAGRPGDALALYRGDLLHGFFVDGAPEFERWLDRERVRLRNRAADAAWACADERARAGSIVEAERLGTRAADLLPHDEAVARRLMTFLQRLGDRAAALRAYEAFTWELKREYELEPSAETRALADAIRAEHSPAATSVHAAEWKLAPHSRPTSVTSLAPDATDARTPDAGRARTAERRRAYRWPAVAALALLVSVGFGLSRRMDKAGGERSAAPRVAILPFRTIGAAEDSYLAEGISDEITTRLATVGGLRVLGTQSVRRYRGSEAPQQIGRDLGVEYVLAGTVSPRQSPSGRRVSIRPQLLRTRDGSELWAAVVDQDMEDVSELFLSVSGIARQVASALHVGVESGTRRGGFGGVPTASPAAYDAYLRGREFMRRNWSPSNTLAAIQLFQEGIARDRKFALAHAWLAIAHTEAHWRSTLGAQHLDRAKEAADAALALEPELPEGQIALGFYYYACCADYERAAWHLERGYARRPGDPLAAMYIGNVYKRRGRWDDAVRYYRRAADADAGWVAPLVNLAQVQLWRREYDDAARTVERVLAIQPQEVYGYAFQAWLALLPAGDTSRARQVVDAAQHAADDDGSMRLAFYLAFLRRDARAALPLTSAAQPARDHAIDIDEGLASDYVRRAFVHRMSGDSSMARAAFDSAAQDLERCLKQASPQSLRAQTWLRASLALAYAGAGRRRDASAQAARVLALDPLVVDAVDGTMVLQNVALTYVLMGDKAAAIGMLQRLLSVPSRLSPKLLRLDPVWDSLRGDRRFEQLVAGAS